MDDTRKILGLEVEKWRHIWRWLWPMSELYRFNIVNRSSVDLSSIPIFPCDKLSIFQLDTDKLTHSTIASAFLQITVCYTHKDRLSAQVIHLPGGLDNEIFSYVDS